MLSCIIQKQNLHPSFLETLGGEINLWLQGVVFAIRTSNEVLRYSVHGYSTYTILVLHGLFLVTIL